MWATVTRALKLAFLSKSGISGGVIAALALAVVALSGALVFGCVLVFVWLSEHFTTFEAAAILTGFFVGLAIIAALAGVLVRRKNMRRAQAQLRAQTAAVFTTPSAISIGYQAGRAIGWRAVLPLALVGLLVFGTGWGSSHRAD